MNPARFLTHALCLRKTKQGKGKADFTKRIFLLPAGKNAGHMDIMYFAQDQLGENLFVDRLMREPPMGLLG